MQDGVFSAEPFTAMINRLLEGTLVVEDEGELDRLGRLGPQDMYATAVVLAAGEARTVEEALAFRASGKRSAQARRAFEVIRGGSSA